MVHHERFGEARTRKEPVETLTHHAQAAEEHYLRGLKLCPKNALIELAPMHHQLGALYSHVGQFDSARDHFEQAAQYLEKTGNRLHAGQTRFGMALMYAQASARDKQSSQQCPSLLRARAYAEAALRDFKHYEGRAAEQEAKTQGLLDQINQALAKLPE